MIILASMEAGLDALICAHKEVFANWVRVSQSGPVPATKWDFANQTLAEQRVNFLDKSYTPICRNHLTDDHLTVLRYVTRQRTQPVIESLLSVGDIDKYGDKRNADVYLTESHRIGVSLMRALWDCLQTSVPLVNDTDSVVFDAIKRLRKEAGMRVEGGTGTAKLVAEVVRSIIPPDIRVLLPQIADIFTKEEGIQGAEELKSYRLVEIQSIVTPGSEWYVTHGVPQQEQEGIQNQVFHHDVNGGEDDNARVPNTVLAWVVDISKDPGPIGTLVSHESLACETLKLRNNAPPTQDVGLQELILEKTGNQSASRRPRRSCTLCQVGNLTPQAQHDVLRSTDPRNPYSVSSCGYDSFLFDARVFHAGKGNPMQAKFRTEVLFFLFTSDCFAVTASREIPFKRHRKHEVSINPAKKKITRKRTKRMCPHPKLVNQALPAPTQVP
jgi:hypothetical protein